MYAAQQMNGLSRNVNVILLLCLEKKIIPLFVVCLRLKPIVSLQTLPHSTPLSLVAIHIANAANSPHPRRIEDIRKKERRK